MARADENVRLDYATAIPWSRRRITRIAIGATILAGIFVAWRCGPAMRDRLNLLYLQRRCMTFQAPADRIVFTNDPADYDRLLKSKSGYFAAPSVFGDRLPDGSAAPPFYIWSECSAWREFPNGRWEPGPAFLHARRTPGGEERLIALELGVLNDRLVVHIRNFKPASLFDAGDWSRSDTTAVGGCAFSMQSIRLYAGQPDPNDESAFTMRVESGKRSRTIAWRVQDNGAVTIESPAEFDPNRWPERDAP